MQYAFSVADVNCHANSTNCTSTLNYSLLNLYSNRGTFMAAINLSSSYSQNFDSLLNSGTNNTWTDDSTIDGWYSNRTVYLAGTGSNNAGALYSFGSASTTDRALGSVASGGTNTIFYGVRFLNNTAKTINSLNINYVGEQWRNGGNTTPQQLDFQYQIGATTITGGTWIDFDSLDFTSPVATATAGALDGNVAARTTLSSTLSGITIAPNQEIWLRWQDLNDAGNDHGLGIDDFSISAGGVTPPTSPTVTIQATDSAAAEAASDPGTFRITRTGSTSASLGVNYTVATGTGQATNGTDYTPNLNGTATIAAGQSFTDITITPVDDSAVEESETVTLTLVDTADYDLGGSSTATVTIADNDTAPPVRIREIQGAAHISPLNGQIVNNVVGIVTALRSNGFYLQDPNPDTNDATSEGIFVFTSSAPTVSVGNSILVSGTVSEFRPGGSGGTNNLTTTQISSPTITTVSTGNPLPAATIVGNGGRTIPTTVISNDAVNGNVENAGTVFDPAQDGIDFYESLEGMLVQVNNAVAVGPTSSNGEIPVLADNGANAGTRTARGGIVIQPGDFNPERIIIDDAIITNEPQVNVADRFNGSIVGVIDYSFSNFKLLNTQALPSVISGGLQREVSNLAPIANQLTVATFNVENLDPGDGATSFNNLASRIVNNLRAPDIINIEEIQDNNGPTNDSVVDATTTYNTLISALAKLTEGIASAGGPTYEFRQINPVDDQDGGEPGGNIRVGFLFNPDRVQFVDRPGGGSTTDTTVNNVGGVPQLSASPGRILDTDSSNGNAFVNSRKPLVGEFLFNGQTVFVVGNHFNSKGGDQPVFGPNQPPALSSEAQRNQQATQVKDFVQSILTINPNANVVVAGDLNDFEFSNPLNILEGAGLNTLIETLPQNERYTYNFEGNAQTLDHILVSNNLLNKLNGFDAVHINSEFAVQDSDHDPVVARFDLTNVINGTSSRDTLVGTAFGDRIIGGLGGDVLTGGGSQNEFVYTNIREGGDTITDFTPGSDKIVFTQLLDSLVTGGYNGSNAIADGYVQFIQGSTANSTTLQIDQDGPLGSGIFRPFIQLDNVSVTAMNNVNNFVF
jgi:predicted extracellular nuclease